MKRIRADRLFRGPPGLEFHGKGSGFLPLPLKLEDHADDGVRRQGAEALHEHDDKTYGKPEEIAYMAVYLLSDLANGVTGEILHVDNGYNTVGMVNPDYAHESGDLLKTFPKRNAE